MALPIVAVVGRPNVGKSTFVNRIAEADEAIVHEMRGVTRDRSYHKADWNGIEFKLIDTGGIEMGTEDQFQGSIRSQAFEATNEADVIVFIVDGKTGINADDEEVARILRKTSKPVLLAVNKLDTPNKLDELWEFYQLGLGDPFPISATHGHGTGDLLDEVVDHLRKVDCSFEDEEDDGHIINVAIIGRPNAGKSSLTNRLTNNDRSIVSDVAGTTRDAVDTPFENEYGKYVFIDTAGIRRKSRVDDRIEKFSVMRAQLAIERADVCIIMLDARDGVTEQDTKIAGMAHEAGKASIIVVNKWDLVEKDGKTMDKLRKDVYRDLAFMSYAPVLFISALTGQRAERIFELVNYVNEQSAMRITTGMLNNVLADAQARQQPPTDKGRRLKIYYMTQTGVRPPNFVIFCNSRELFHFSYQRYIENQIRAVFGLEGTPIRIVIRQKGDKEC